MTKKKTLYKQHTFPEYIVSEQILSPELDQSLSLYHKLSLMSLSQANQFDLMDFIKKGVSGKLLRKVMKAIDFDIEQMATVLHVSSRTLHRLSDSDKLGVEQSERVVELIALYNYGYRVFGDEATFHGWMDAQNFTLRSMPPRYLLDTSAGIRVVTMTIGRIEFGIYS
jgi:putative toxin-antitoxin system antitoxin component (TIGR02293 family)